MPIQEVTVSVDISGFLRVAEAIRRMAIDIKYANAKRVVSKIYPYKSPIELAFIDMKKSVWIAQEAIRIESERYLNG
jgi:hypothetical protein